MELLCALTWSATEARREVKNTSFRRFVRPLVLVLSPRFVIYIPKIHKLVHLWESSRLPFPAEESYM